MLILFYNWLSKQTGFFFCKDYLIKQLIKLVIFDGNFFVMYLQSFVSIEVLRVYVHKKCCFRCIFISCLIATMDTVTSQRGSAKFILDRYVYVKQKNLAKGVISLDCELKRHSKCKAKIQVKDNVCVGQTNEHTHAPDIGHAEALVVRQNI